MIRELHKYQIHDPGKGSFLVNPMPVKSARGGALLRKCSDGIHRPVYRAAHYKARENRRMQPTMMPHPEAIDFVLMEGTYKVT